MDAYIISTAYSPEREQVRTYPFQPAKITQATKTISDNNNSKTIHPRLP